MIASDALESPLQSYTSPRLIRPCIRMLQLLGKTCKKPEKIGFNSEQNAFSLNKYSQMTMKYVCYRHLGILIQWNLGKIHSSQAVCRFFAVTAAFEYTAVANCGLHRTIEEILIIFLQINCIFVWYCSKKLKIRRDICCSEQIYSILHRIWCHMQTIHTSRIGSNIMFVE